MANRVPECTQGEPEDYVDRQTRLWNVALILSDAGSDDKNIINTLQEMKSVCARNFGEADQRTLVCMSKLALMYGRTGHLWEAESEFWRMFWMRTNSQGGNEDMMRELADFVAMCNSQGHFHRAQNFDKAASLLKMTGRY
ncbi:hypothetical protein V8C42DRAFT_258580 [Trichoderma barbatum]